MVTNINDSGPGSLRQAILDADNTVANPGQNTIHFAIAPSGVQTIAVDSALPFLSNPAGIVLDATTEGGFAGTPLVVIDGGSKVPSHNGLMVTGGNSTIKGLAIVDFFIVGAAIDLASSNNTVQGNFLGVNAAGTAAAENYYGIYLPAGASNNTIGGTTPAARNVISGNDIFGILLEGSGTSGNLIEGNLIGTDVSGTMAVPNGFDGIGVTGASGNTIGGTVTGAGNQISGNGRFGVMLSSAGTTGNVLQQNNIGLNAALTAKLTNGSDGVSVLPGATGATIGGTATTTAGNVISGNGRFGVLLAGTGNVVLNNLIGTDSTGAVALGNTLDGVGVSEAGNTIGGTATNAGNVISGNGRFGVFLTGPGASGTVVSNNNIGAAKGGTAKLGNTYDGVALVAGASGNTIGGTTTGAGNLLSGNNRFGIFLTDSDTGANLIEGNTIGLTGAGTMPLGNTFDGIAILSGASGNTIGGTVTGAMNVIGSNQRFGVLIGVTSTSDNVVEGNHIGTGAAGLAAFANVDDGVAIVTGASDNTIGGTTAASRNLIAGNSSDGVLVDASAGNLIAANFIGTDATGKAALPNSGNGVDLADGATNNTIGGTVTGARNVISGNHTEGIGIDAANGNVIRGNVIGTDIAGTTAVPNGDDGLFLFASASGNTIGGATTGSRNLVSGNTHSGFFLLDSANNVLLGNYIGTDAAGTVALANGNSGAEDLLLRDATDNTIGGTTAAARNVIASNGNNTGIDIQGSTPAAATGNVVEGNYIGTNAAGTATLGNFIGVELDVGDSANTIGGTATGSGNLISGNTTGVLIQGLTGRSATDNLVEGNLIGTDATGTLALGNTGDGVDLEAPASGNTIGGTVTGARNVISGNNDGIVLSGTATTGNAIQGNFIGTDVTGTKALANAFAGVEMQDFATTNTVGGTTAGARNVISGNSLGIALSGTASANLIQGNFIGTDVSGTLAVPNTGDGGVALDAAANTVGGTVAGARNVISGNKGAGIDVDGAAAADNLVQGNFIGTDVSGTIAVPNVFTGILFTAGAADNTIGGTVTGAANVISGNGVGIDVAGGSSDNVVQGNLIGTNPTGTLAVANTGDGVDILAQAADNTIGGTLAGAGNVVSGNMQAGIEIAGTGTNNNLIQGNRIGTDTAGTVGVANLYGVLCDNGTSGNTIGGTVAGAGNVVSGNTFDGIAVQDTGTSNILIQGNKIGTDAAGTAALPNVEDGVILVSSASNTVGGTTAGAGNVISGNKQNGINLNKTTNNLIQGNLIGTDISGTVAVPNIDDGVAFDESPSSNTVGGTAAGAGNVISANGMDGILVFETGTTNNLIQGNFIGTDRTGTLNLGNTGPGVSIGGGAASNTVGGTVAGAANIIAFNDVSVTNGIGVQIGDMATDNTTVGNAVLGNSIHNNGGSGGLGIDLGSDGHTANHTTSPTGGPNDFQNFPVPTAATLSSGNVSVSFTFSSVASSTFRLEFFLNNSGDTPQGRFFLGSVNVTTDSNGALSTVTGGSVSMGVGTIVLTPPAGVTPATGQGLTATATLLSPGGNGSTVGDTSEFSFPAVAVS
jgi:parallel beta-helix repeat protein